MTDQPEYSRVERPLIDQLVSMGWQHRQGALPGKPATDCASSDRASFTEALYADRFQRAVSRINLRPDGTPWLSEEQLDWLLKLVLGTAPGQGPEGKGVAGNIQVTRLLREGVNARRLPGWQETDPAHVRLVDWDGECAPGNDYLAVSQFRVERPGAGAVIPDLVLFVNGLPWAVIECKAPVTSCSRDRRFPVDQAVGQVIGYAGVDAPSAVTEFTRFAQLLIATDGVHAELGTVTAEARHFAPWRTVEPSSEEQVREETGTPPRGQLSAQQVLVAGVLRPAHLLTLIRDFTTETGQGPRTIKAVGRYQQFRAVHRLTARLRSRRRAVEAGQDVDQRGGVVWHTQGSGKSLTMAFLVRHLRSTKDLRGHKVVVVTDRKDLEKQIKESLAAADEKIHRSRSVVQARSFLSVDVPDVSLVMLQKAQRDDSAWDGREEKLAESPDGEDHVHNKVANAGHDIVVLVDEAHRGHMQWQHARLRAMLPNAVLVGFTGTPILSRARKSTEDIFGAFADTYTLRDAEADGAVVPVRYEAHSVQLEVIEKAFLDAEFDVEIPADPERRDKVLREFARRKEILEAPSVIAAKADHMLRHWARTALPERFGAQVVAVSRLAAVRYQEALLSARDRLLSELDGLDPDLAHDPHGYEEASAEERELLDLLPSRELLASIKAAVVISKAGWNSRQRDPATWHLWTNKTHQEAHIARFQKGLGDPRAAALDPSWHATTHGAAGSALGQPCSSGDPWDGYGAVDVSAKDDTRDEAPIAFLVVQSMLLTGFDAPVEQVLYLDCPLCGVGLLQAIARTNRPYFSKEWGQVVDYVGIGPELSRSLAEYDEAHLRAVYGYEHYSFDHLDPAFQGDQPVRDIMWLETDAATDAQLRSLHEQITRFLTSQGLSSLADAAQREDLLAALADPLLLGEFDELVRDFLTALNAVLPRPRALDFERDARFLGEVQYLARQRYLDGQDDFSPRRYGAKIRQLISRHLQVSDIQQRIPPVNLTAPDFMERVASNNDVRARTSYMRSRLDLHITARLRSDPVRYQRFSDRLAEIIRRMEEDFDAAAAALVSLVSDVQAAEADDATTGGLERWTEQPVYEVLREALETSGDRGTAGIDLIQASRDLTVHLATKVSSPDFVTLTDTQIRVRREVRAYLESRLHLDWVATGPVSSSLVDLALDQHAEFLRYGRGVAT
ncbi:HsdR family type I site-specific deoxyribonuclease [Streptomyces chumphonensis]|uniref:type I restriction endonuclease subunit R n=1 Tax=Streptomyces chumphonensis TaxID=1214925 RepID=UPI00296573B6|nr:type I restriction endonuclease [Streptomyces chumphonensis]